jgi:Ca2+-binding RTX toxin-like protein
MSRLLPSVLAGLLASLLAVSPAAATTVRQGSIYDEHANLYSETLTVRGSEARNAIEVGWAVRSRSFTVSDTEPIDAPDSCRHSGPREVRCPTRFDDPLRLQETLIAVFAGGGGDRVAIHSSMDRAHYAVSFLNGQAGPDVIDGGPISDRIDGGPGDDIERGHAGGDELGTVNPLGDPGRDVFLAGGGFDHVYAAGGGVDERIDCGGKRDGATVGRADPRPERCERVER